VSRKRGPSSVPFEAKRVALVFMLSVMTPIVWGSQCEPLWQEDFDQPLQPGLWNYVEGDGCSINLCGWGNNEQQTYDAAHVAVTDGTLKIRAAIDSEGTIRSGKITTQGKFATRFGRIEARIKVPAGRGTWPAFWMMPDPTDQPWPNQGEIDILEWTGNHPHRVIGAVHFGDVWPDNVHYSETLLTPTDWSEDFHNYGVIWEPGAVHWYTDGRIHATANADNIAPWRWVFDDNEFYLILNLAIGGNLGGEVVRSDLPVTMEVDWVRIYDQTCQDGLVGPQSAKFPRPSAETFGASH